MTPQQILLVRSSFARVAPIADHAAALFYDNLFLAQPTLRSLFRNADMARQGEKLMQMIGAAVKLLDNAGALMPVLRQLGARHGGYGVQPQHYAMVGDALMKTLAQGLGDAFDEPTRNAWATMYGVVSRTMIEAAQSGVTQPA
jgi:hemoglobin-like flavoprotein